MKLWRERLGNLHFTFTNVTVLLTCFCNWSAVSLQRGVSFRYTAKRGIRILNKLPRCCLCTLRCANLPFMPIVGVYNLDFCLKGWAEKIRKKKRRNPGPEHHVPSTELGSSGLPHSKCDNISPTPALHPCLPRLHRLRCKAFSVPLLFMASLGLMFFPLLHMDFAINSLEK